MARLLETSRVTAIPRLSVVAMWNKTEAASAIYTPPPGWVVLQTEVEVHSSNRGSREISTIGGGLNLATEEILTSAFDAAIDVAGSMGDSELKARLEEKKNASTTEIRKYSSNMNTIQAIVRAKGSGKFYDRGKGWEEITVAADILYVGSSDINEVVVSIEQEFGIDVPGLGGGD